ncbi:DUF4359 domain-containing protein [Neobacillus sp. SuZ13]|uniref:DUF4359 domain-containing protein n=1 Tax=Neobacillus sp. SuZ13 TaxID=3047875 RepID=UPI0024BF47D9|nr:DUF4359 domain-containing protein [Neobacillus sp. SuZ13]WHY64675.1 DUF4359 domain-containing protein [Neobacillus sp. SuZ13]
MRTRFVISALLLLFCLLAFSSNPTKSDYVSFVKEEITEEGHPFIGMFTSPLVNNFTTKQNYGLFTIYKTKFEEKDKEYMQAIGIFNNFYWIHTPDK